MESIAVDWFGLPSASWGHLYWPLVHDKMQCVIQRKTVLHCIEVWAAKRKLGTSILAPGANYSNAELGVMYNVKLHFIVEKAVICNAMLCIM